MTPPSAKPTKSPAKSRRWDARPNKTCQQCGAPYYAAPAHAAQRRYCSAACRARADGYDPPHTVAARLPERGQPGFIGSIPQALALVEAQLAVADPALRGTLAIERDVLREILREQRMTAQEAG